MIVRRITYWTAGDAKTYRDFDVSVGVQDAINLLVDNPQEPLAQVERIELMEIEEEQT